MGINGILWSNKVDIITTLGANNDDLISYLIKLVCELGQIMTRYDLLGASQHNFHINLHMNWD